MVQEFTVAMLGIGTAVPETLLEQSDVAARMADALQAYPDSARWAKRIFRQAGVNTRYTCEPNLREPADRCRYLSSVQTQDAPRTAERMETYRNASVPLAIKAARAALEQSEIVVDEITHLFAVSCTGMFLPGLDIAIKTHLGLAANVQRIPLNFLGCAAGMTAIRMAHQVVNTNPQAKVLIVSVELCTLHVQPSAAREDLFATAFFGDGASACIIGTPDHRHEQVFTLQHAHSVLLPDSADEMVWDISDFGFHLYLSPRIPELITQMVPREVELFWKKGPKPEIWAIHPGGRGIVDAIQELYGLTDEQMEPSRSVLRQYGNMSSATILFVLAELRNKLIGDRAAYKEGIALAFGPGMQAELLRIAYEPEPARTLSDKKPEDRYV